MIRHARPLCVPRFWIAGIAAASAQNSFALALSHSAEFGVETLIAHQWSWDRDCNPQPATVKIINPPANGTISVLPAVIRPSRSGYFGDGSTGRCVGKAVPDNQIIYKSEPGFHGKDRVF